MSSFFSNLFKRFKAELNILSDSHRSILCVDDDRDFCLYLSHIAKNLNLNVTHAYCVGDAKKKIEQNPTLYDAYVIDGHMPDGSGFELIAWMREEKRIDSPIGFLSRVYQDALSYRKLKELYHVEYVLDKPLDSNAIQRFLSQLTRKPSALSDENPEETNRFLDELKLKYQKTIIDKIEMVEHLIIQLQNHPSSENLNLLKNEIHKIAGSAGSFGYLDVSYLCKNLESEIQQQLNEIEEKGINSTWLMSLDIFFTQLKLHYQMNLKD